MNSIIKEKQFTICEICGTDDWMLVYQGKIRDGTYGSYRKNTIVGKCKGCGVERLEEDVCPPKSFYETEEYRAKLKAGIDSQSYILAHDRMKISR